MISPYQSDQLRPLYVQDADQRAALLKTAEALPPVSLNSSAVGNTAMLGGGYFTPLSGFMNKADALSVAESMTTRDGLFWPVPILNTCTSVDGISGAGRIALRDPNTQDNQVVAIQTVDSAERVSDEEMQYIAGQVFGTTDTDHPGVSTFLNQGRWIVSGPVQVLSFGYFETEFPDTFRTAYQIRESIEQLGWKDIVAFQTRNPMHRAHEELCKIALERTGSDGVVIHMLLGKLKPGDIPAKVRDDAIRTMVDLYFPPNSALINGYGFDMLYAGPREAILHAIFRQNLGATYMIVGRDHAGVGDYYGAFDAQTIFHETAANDVLEIKIFEADHTAWSKKLNEVVMMRDAPDHERDDFILLSGTRVREMLTLGEALPPEFSRPEVAKILMEHYQNR